MAGARGHHQWRGAIGRLGVDIRGMVDQVLDHVVMAIGGGVVQRGPAGLVDLGLHLVDHQLDHVELALQRRHHQRGLPGGVGLVEIDVLGADQHRCRLERLLAQRQHQRRVAAAVDDIGIDALGQQLLDGIGVVELDRLAHVVGRRGLSQRGRGQHHGAGGAADKLQVKHEHSCRYA
ncbi:hypothetical protein D9M68_775190 [compost metagenome]